MRGAKDRGAKEGHPKATAKREREIAASGLTPLGYILEVLRDDEESPRRRDWAAVSAAPYCHPKLAAVGHAGPDQEPMTLRVVYFGSIEADPDCSTAATVGP